MKVICFCLLFGTRKNNLFCLKYSRMEGVYMPSFAIAKKEEGMYVLKVAVNIHSSILRNDRAVPIYTEVSSKFNKETKIK
jgi:hypothetical protein